MKAKIALLFLCALSGIITANIPKDPKVVIVFVIDQFPFYYFTRHEKNFKANGFNRFIKQGVFYTNARHSHGIPETSPGHATLSTGVLPTEHGVASNRWFDEDSHTIEFSEDDSQEATLLNAPADAIGRSSHHMVVDTISDQMSMHQATKSNYKAFSLGIKETSAIATAGHKMPAFWFNRYQGGFTSSKHYMRQLPRWVKKFNERCGIRQLKHVPWNLCFDANDQAYNFEFIDNYDFAALPFKLAGNKNIQIDRSDEDPYENYLRTPAANKLLLDFATSCVKNNYKHHKHEKLLLWVCLSPLDLVGHMYGPDSMEIVDFIHHIDLQLDKCMSKIERLIGQDKVAFILTADHGIQPIQEISKLSGNSQARRILAAPLMKKINEQIKNEYGVSNLLTRFESTYFVYDQHAVDELTENENLDQAEALAKKILLNEPGIKEAWTYKELKNLSCVADSHAQFYKNHLFHNRVGDLIVQPNPFCLVTNYPKGCSHNTPYKYDVHVPLAFHQKGMPAQKIDTKVCTTQLAPTIAQMLNIPAPSASMQSLLPHFLDKKLDLSTHAHKAFSNSLNGPKFIVPIVIDQGAYHYFTRFNNYFRHGFRRFLDRGVIFTNTHHPHGAPVTATGHATLSTGALPAKHGIIMNSWYTKEGDLVASINDDRPEARVHATSESCDCQASSKTLMCPSVSDIAVQASSPDLRYHCYGISYKDRAAIGMAGHLGKAIWFDEHQQAFTSNYAYFKDELPEWLIGFNKILPKKIEAARSWKLFFERDHKVYTNYAKEIYHLSSAPLSIAGTELRGLGNWKKLQSEKNFMYAPQSNSILLDAALDCMDDIAKNEGVSDRGLIWVSLSSLDKIGHMYGPHSIEGIDTILHLDKIIGDFMSTAEQRYGQGNVVFFLTADHGGSPIPENLKEENYPPAKRIIMHKVVADLNKKIKKKFDIDSLFFGFKTNQLFWNEKKLKNITPKKKSKIISFIKNELKALKGISNIWTYDEIALSHSAIGTPKNLLKNQLYPGRSGAFFCLGNPYVMLTNFDKGSCHRTPYNYDTHIPLMALCEGKFTHHTVRNKIWSTQLAPTIAKLWGLKQSKEMTNKALPHIKYQ